MSLCSWGRSTDNGHLGPLSSRHLLCDFNHNDHAITILELTASHNSPAFFQASAAALSRAIPTPSFLTPISSVPGNGRPECKRCIHPQSTHHCQTTWSLECLQQTLAISLTASQLGPTSYQPIPRSLPASTTLLLNTHTHTHIHLL